MRTPLNPFIGSILPKLRRGFIFTLDAIVSLLMFYAIISMAFYSNTSNYRTTYLYDNIIHLTYEGYQPLELAQSLGYCGVYFENNKIVKKTCDCAISPVLFPCDQGVCGLKLCKNVSQDTLNDGSTHSCSSNENCYSEV